MRSVRPPVRRINAKRTLKFSCQQFTKTNSERNDVAVSEGHDRFNSGLKRCLTEVGRFTLLDNHFEFVEILPSNTQTSRTKL